MNTEGTSLDDLLNPAEPVEETVSEPVEETQSERPRDETGKFVSTKGVEPAEPDTEQQEAVPPTDKLPKEDYKAIREEREKRQTLERELEALKTQFQQLTQEPPAPPPSVWEDEQGYGNNLVTTAVSQATFNARLDMSEMLASQAHDDFDQMKDRFLSMMQQNPALQQQALAAKHPWERAYQIAKNAATMEEFGATNVDEMREKLKAELLAELQQGTTPVAGKQLPATLTGERSVASRTGPAWSGPTPLGDLLR